MNVSEKISCLIFPISADDTTHQYGNILNEHKKSINIIFKQLEMIDKISSNADVQHIETIISEFVNQLPGPITPEKLFRYDQTIYIDWRKFAQTTYMDFIQIIIGKFDQNWPSNDASINFIDLFLIDTCADFIFSTMSAMTSIEHKTKMPIFCNIFEKIMKSDTMLFAAIVDSSYYNSNNTNDRLQYDFIQQLTSLPNRIANEMKTKMPHIFVPEHFCNIVMVHILKAIYFMANVNGSENAKIFDTKFLSQLFGKIIIDYNCNRTSKALQNSINILVHWTQNEKTNMTLFINEILLNLNRQAIDVISIILLNGSHDIYSMLQSAIVDDKNWQYCLLTKIPLLNYYASECVPVNLVRYLTSVKNDDKFVINLLMELLDIWSNKICIVKSTIEQQIYITKIIILIVHAMVTHFSNDIKERIKQKLYTGIQYHIESQTSTIRCIGMITTEILLNVIETKEISDENKLKFDYTSFKGYDAVVLKSLNELEQRINEPLQCNCMDSNLIIDEMIEQYTANSNVVEKTNKPITVVNKSVASNIEYYGIHHNLTKMSEKKLIKELDSDDDDDLEPYDMSNDITTAAIDSPKYLLDLKAQILETEDGDIFAKCLEISQQLIEEQLPNNDIKLGLELLRIFLSLEQKFYTENFNFLRMSACVAICCVYPKESAEYLCKQFHTKIGEYSISTKVLMLDILSESCKVLSKITVNKEQSMKIPSATSRSSKQCVQKLLNISDVANEERKKLAANVIRQRIEAKTRRFATKTLNPFKFAQKNKFSDVAGYFFYPLLHGFGERQLNLTVNKTLPHDIDNVLLINLLNTISTIMLAAENCIIAVKFAEEIFRLTTLLRFSAEPKIRAATTQMIATVFMAVSKEILLNVLFNEIFEIKNWLEMCVDSNIIHGERNENCREIARYTLALCYDCLN